MANLIIKIYFLYDYINDLLNRDLQKKYNKIITDAGYPAVLGGLVMSLSFIAFVVSMSITTVANVVFIISTQTMFLAIFGYLYLKEKHPLLFYTHQGLSEP